MKLVFSTGCPIALVAREFGIKEQTVGGGNLLKDRQDAGGVE
ncbi:hypothetical protein [Demequina lutea]|uniref:Uncharacterized protein n=1 Tax=Demequina lutea TaxID=431489 RepID=A0A7Y9Z8D5_9MICO|nr:hypothetical protein [Demequina lutea]NYI40491.1 hypothetical protein [Demequina lutea]